MMHQHNFPPLPADDLRDGLKEIREAAVDASEKVDQAISIYHALKKFVVDLDELVDGGSINSTTVASYFKGEFRQMETLLGLQYDLLKSLEPKLERAELAESLLSTRATRP